MVISCHDDNNYMVDEKSRLEAHGVSSWGQVLIVTPNAQRNMFTIITSARHHSIWSILSTTITQWPRSCVPGSASVFTIITNVPATPRAAQLLVVQRHSMKLPTGMPWLTPMSRSSSLTTCNNKIGLVALSQPTTPGKCPVRRGWCGPCCMSLRSVAAHPLLVAATEVAGCACGRQHWLLFGRSCASSSIASGALPAACLSPTLLVANLAMQATSGMARNRTS